MELIWLTARNSRTLPDEPAALATTKELYEWLKVLHKTGRYPREPSRRDAAAVFAIGRGDTPRPGRPTTRVSG